jgi:PASTA domain
MSFVKAIRSIGASTTCAGRCSPPRLGRGGSAVLGAWLLAPWLPAPGNGALKAIYDRKQQLAGMVQQRRAAGGELPADAAKWSTDWERHPWQPSVPFSPISQTTVPDVVELSEEKAGEAIKQAGLVAEMKGDPHATNRHVATQSPAAGTRLHGGSVVTCFLVGGSVN